MPVTWNDGTWPWLRKFLLDLQKKVESFVIDPTPPDKVENLTLTKVSGGSLLEWTSANRAFFYKLYRSKTSNQFTDALQFATLVASDDPEFFDINSRGAGNYFYWVVSTNKLGITSTPSSVVTVTF